MLSTILLLLLAPAFHTEITSDINTFGLKLLQYTPNDENVMISPYSICTAFAMLNAGAAGNTKTQIDEAFGWSRDDTSAQYKTLISQINAAGQNIFNLSSSNRMYADLTFEPLESYTTKLSENFEADLEEVNFSDGDNSATVEDINTWVEEQTNGKIENMFTEISNDVRAILINTIYFKASWLYPFSTVTQETFYLDSEYAVQTDTMTIEKILPYYSDDDVELVELPYNAGSSRLSMIVIKPTSRGGLLELEQDVIKYQFSKISEWMDDIEYQKLQLSMPKFEFEAKLPDLRTIFENNFGITDVFGNSADLSGISESEGLSVSQIIHQSFISVDEDGTEAAAATAIIVEVTSVDETKPKVVMINQPFMFLIYDNDNDVVLFTGRLLIPNEDNLSAKYLEDKFVSSGVVGSFFKSLVVALSTTMIVIHLVF